MRSKDPVFSGVENFVKDCIRKNTSQFVAKVDGEIVGWCDIVPQPREEQCHIGKLGVGILPEFRKMGIGNILINKSLEHAQKMGIEVVFVETLEQNISAIELFKKYEFKVVGIKEKFRKTEHGFDNIIMLLRVLQH